MKFIVEMDEMAIIKELAEEGEIYPPMLATENQLCEFIASSIGLQVDGLEPETEIKVEILHQTV